MYYVKVAYCRFILKRECWADIASMFQVLYGGPSNMYCVK